jgi:hypothetical protein
MTWRNASFVLATAQTLNVVGKPNALYQGTALVVL